MLGISISYFSSISDVVEESGNSLLRVADVIGNLRLKTTISENRQTLLNLYT